MTLRNQRDTPRWPDVSAGSDDELDKVKLAETAKRRGAFNNELDKLKLAETAKRRGAFDDADKESQVAIEVARIDVLKGTLERFRDSAKTVQSAAATIATVYAGIVALVFSVAADQPLPLRGIIPVFYLGTAIVFSTSYLSWPSAGPQVRDLPDELDSTDTWNARVNWFNDWVSISVLGKAWRLQTATLCLAAGLVFLPSALIPVTGPTGPAGLDTVPSAWPAIVDTGNPLQDAILFQAKVDEAAEQRTKANTNGPSATNPFTIPERIIWIAALLAALVIGCFARRLARLNKDLVKQMGTKGGQTAPTTGPLQRRVRIQK